MKYLFNILIVFLIISCQGAVETDQLSDIREMKDSLLSEPDTTNNEKKTIIDESRRFHYFEDYIKLRTKKALYEEFETKWLRDDTSYYAEGTISYAVTYFRNPANGHVVKYVWTGESGVDSLFFIEASYFHYNEEFEIIGSQSIPSVCGVYLGMPIKELVNWNEEDIDFMGFSWDYAGALLTKENTKVADCPVKITLDLDRRKANSDFNELMGDIELSTASKLVIEAPILVETLVYSP